MDDEQRHDIALLMAVLRAYGLLLGAVALGVTSGVTVAVLAGWMPGY